MKRMSFISYICAKYRFLAPYTAIRVFKNQTCVRASREKISVKKGNSAEHRS